MTLSPLGLRTHNLESLLLNVDETSSRIFATRYLNDANYDLCSSYCEGSEFFDLAPIEDQINFMLFIMEAKNL